LLPDPSSTAERHWDFKTNAGTVASNAYGQYGKSTFYQFALKTLKYIFVQLIVHFPIQFFFFLYNLQAVVSLKCAACLHEFLYWIFFSVALLYGR
jgi:hypothetical protein